MNPRRRVGDDGPCDIGRRHNALIGSHGHLTPAIGAEDAGDVHLPSRQSERNGSSASGQKGCGDRQRIADDQYGVQSPVDGGTPQRQQSCDAGILEADRPAPSLVEQESDRVGQPLDLLWPGLKLALGLWRIDPASTKLRHELFVYLQDVQSLVVAGRISPVRLHKVFCRPDVIAGSSKEAGHGARAAPMHAEHDDAEGVRNGLWVVSSINNVHQSDTKPTVATASTLTDRPTVVVNLIGDPARGVLAESRFVERPFLPGGEHNMYELAFAAVEAGYRVELRGWLDEPAFAAFRDALGFAPEVDLPSRPAKASDLVIVPEGWRDPLDYLRLLLSPARVVMFVLAPPGLFGWPFASWPWEPPDPLTVALDSVATPAQFRALHQLRIPLLTHSPGIVAAAEGAGVPCALVGVGRPYAPPPAAEERATDVAALMANRWAPLVQSAAGDLDGLSVDLIEEAGNTEVVLRLARARVLLWPSRIEGHATIPWEARSVGCVPVALSSNRFAVGLSESAGAVVVDHVEELAPAIRGLVKDQKRWHELSVRARTHAREEADWSRYVERVAACLQGLPAPDEAIGARAGMGAALLAWETRRDREWQSRLEELSADREKVASEREEYAVELDRVRQDRDGLVHDRAQLVHDRDRLAGELEALKNLRAVRVALKLDSMRGRGS